jgi:hypothetical protein
MYCVGSIPYLEDRYRDNQVIEPSDAEVIIINGDGIIDPGTGTIIENNKATKRIICVGPSTAGVARLQELEHWCPYGRSCTDNSGRE